jgi:hypothetical protein
VKALLSALALALVPAGTGCAATSCPGVFLNPGVHVDATAWVGDVPLDQPSIRATICIADRCGPATPLKTGGYDLFGATTLPKEKATVRVQLTLSTARTLDRTATAEVTLAKPFGSGCAGREEIDLTVTKAGAVVPGRPAKTN